MNRRRTYWHLEGMGRKPSDYDIATSRLLYYPELGYAVKTPVSEWQARYAGGSGLRCTRWERFRDPRQTTYAAYVARQERREIFVDGLLEAATHTDAQLDPSWVLTLERLLPVLRYPLHGLQMVAAGAGALVPGGRVTVAFLFQAADELRRVQRLAYRMRQLQDAWPGFGEAAQSVWEDDPIWQPWREIIERLFAVRDLGETFAALNLAVKPIFDEVFFGRFAERGRAAGDDVLHKLFLNLREDGVWHAEWSRALVEMLVEEDAGNAAFLEDHTGRWRAMARAAADAMAPLLPAGDDRAS